MAAAAVPDDRLLQSGIDQVVLYCNLKCVAPAEHAQPLWTRVADGDPPAPRSTVRVQDVRRHIERRLGLEPFQLDAHKERIRAMLIAALKACGAAARRVRSSRR